ncbi:MAG TPA: DUF333 domain-containing protein [Scandinavium sp.]|jgi:hypothetical protein
MKKMIIATAVVIIAGCSNQSEQNPPVGLANPASIYCIKQGGKLDIEKTSNGEIGYCNLPSHERVEEWTLYRRNNGK